MAASDNINSHQVRNILNDIERRTGVRPLPGALQLPTGDVVEAQTHRGLEVVPGATLVESLVSKKDKDSNGVIKTQIEGNKYNDVVFRDFDSVDSAPLKPSLVGLQGPDAKQRVKDLNLKPGYPGIKNPNPRGMTKPKGAKLDIWFSNQYLKWGYEGRPFNLYTQEFDDHIAN